MQAGSPAADGQPSHSVLTPSGYYSSSCGYCKSKPRKTRYAIGAIVSSLQPSHYQILVDSGWRRSGSYLYKPDGHNSCCPHYTIRLDAPAFQPAKDQRKVANRWNHYILGHDYLCKAARLCPQTRDEKRRRRNCFSLSETVLGCEYANVKKPIDKRTKESIEPAHKFEVTLEPDQFTKEKYALYADYQRRVHGETEYSEFSPSGFERFLCSGIKQGYRIEDGRIQKFGSYHQCYRMDGRLIALGVLDLLPNCVSSVYLIYHSDYIDWNFGKLSVMREIYLAIEGGYRYYYMGYYIHSCIKMRYKGTFKPTYVLDPETYAWDLLDSDMLQRISIRKFVSMSREREFNLSATTPGVFLQSENVICFNFTGELDFGLEKFKSLAEYVQTPPLAEPERTDYSSVFESRMPGIMPMAEVAAKIDLGAWRLKFEPYSNVKLSDLVGWEESDMSDPHSDKGMVAQLAACIPHELIKQTMITFYGV